VVAIRWDPVATATSYQLDISNDPDFLNLTSSTIETTWFTTVTTIQFDIPYYIRVRAINSAGISPYSPRLLYTIPAAPTELRVYPNPTTGNFNIDLDLLNSEASTEIRVLNASGEPVKLIQRGPDRSSTESIDLSGEPIGIYTIQFFYGGQLVRKHLVKL
jgi:hypothetical protein